MNLHEIKVNAYIFDGFGTVYHCSKTPLNLTPFPSKHQMVFLLVEL